jgi:single-stranded DNA-binding protein
MNSFHFIGMLTSPAKLIQSENNGPGVNFHCMVNKTKSTDPEVWLQCSFWGRRSQEILKDLWQGQIVTVEGTVTGHSEGPIFVRVKHLVVHWPNAEDADA